MTDPSQPSGFVLVGHRATVLVAGEDVERFREPIQQLLASGGDIADLVEVMTIDGLASVPDFGGLIRVSDNDHRIVVRGDVTLTIDTNDPATASTLTGVGVATWREDLVADAALLRLSHPSGLSVDVVGSGGQPHEGRVRPAGAPGEKAQLTETSPRDRPPVVHQDRPDSDPAPTKATAESTTARVAATAEQVSTPAEPATPSEAPPAAQTGATVEVADRGTGDPQPQPAPESPSQASGTAGSVAGQGQSPGDPGRLSDTGSAEIDEQSFDLSHLTGDTRYWGVEAAAVRASPPPADEVPTDPAPPPPPPPPERQGPAVPAPSPGPRPSGLIDSVPVSISAGGEVPLGDHDGRTVGPSDPALSAARLALQAKGRTGAIGTGVASTLCPAHHPNPPTAERCRVCGVEVADRSIHLLPRPCRGQLTFAHGLTVLLDRTQLIGRQPRPLGAADDDDVVNLVSLPDPEQELSRLHAEIRLEGWEVFVIDRSSNGTWVEVPGEELTKLRKGERCHLPLGSWVSLAESASFTFEIARS